MKRLQRIVVFLVTAVVLTGCGWQAIPEAKNKVEASTAEINNQYKRRADLIPNLVNVVKGYAKHEEGTLTAVTEARAKATQATIDPSKMDPNQLKSYMDAQGNLSQALGRLMVVVEKYPELKADQNFRDLQAQIEGTENRITVARNRSIDAIREFNNLVTVPPTSWTNSIIYHYEKLPQWSVNETEQKQNEQAPKVEF